jgi:predicted DNA-binding transcriptional regulator YafY
VTLADELGLELRAPHLLAQRWLEGLPQAQRDAARHQVQTVLEALRHRDADRGVEDYRLPSPTAPLLPELERAIAQGATIEMDYHTAGRQHLLSRRVDPLRLEWRGGVPYLVAFCHLRQEPRVFRVDRIERISESANGE